MHCSSLLKFCWRKQTNQPYWTLNSHWPCNQPRVSVYPLAMETSSMSSPSPKTEELITWIQCSMYISLLSWITHSSHSASLKHLCYAVKTIFRPQQTEFQSKRDLLFQVSWMLLPETAGFLRRGLQSTLKPHCTEVLSVNELPVKTSKPAPRPSLTLQEQCAAPVAQKGARIKTSSSYLLATP